MGHVPLAGIFFSLPFNSMSSHATKIEQYIINKVKEKRIETGLSQADLSFKLGLTDSFVAHVETPKRRDKYNVNHLNKLAKIFKCSIKDFFPDKPL